MRIFNKIPVLLNYLIFILKGIFNFIIKIEDNFYNFSKKYSIQVIRIISSLNIFMLYIQYNNFFDSKRTQWLLIIWVICWIFKYDNYELFIERNFSKKWLYFWLIMTIIVSLNYVSNFIIKIYNQILNLLKRYIINII
jgi:uncharacterized membrane protein